MKEVRIAETFSRAWAGVKANWLMLLGLLAAYFAVALLANILQRLAGEGILASLGSWALSTGINCIFYLILLKFSLQVALKGGAKVELFSEMELDGAQVWRFVRTYLLTTALLIAILGACFVPVLLLALLSAGVAVFSDQGAWKAFIGPGLACGAVAIFVFGYAAVAFSESVYICFHQALGPVDSLAESWRITRDARGGLLLMGLASGGLMLAGLICLLLGVIPALMVVFLAQPIVYLSLLEQSGPRP
jgi:hypothetical protein